MSSELTAEYYTEKARRELNETELRKAQSLEKFKKWIAKHSFISNIDPDDSLLLMVLRARKYNLNEAFQSFEINIINYAMSPSFLESFDKPLELLKNGFEVAFKKRDENGCRNILFDVGKIDVKKFSFDDVVTAAHIVLYIFANEPETQICGVNLYFDMTNFTMDHLSLLMSNKSAHCIQGANLLLFRLKKITFIGLSSIVETFLKFVRKFLSKKLQNRMVFATQCDFIVGVDEIEDLMLKYNEMKASFEKLRNVVVNFDGVKKNYKYEDVGSFRQLEID